MRLLNKKDIHQAQAAQQKKEADEGLKLARRVDSLRELAADEEASLERFRVTTLKRIHAETKEAAEKRDNLKKEVGELEQTRKELLKPLDKEWGEVKQARADVEQAQKDNDKKKAELDEREKGIVIANAEATHRLTQARDKDERSNSRLHEAERSSTKAKDALANAKKVEADALQLKEDMEKELAHRDMELAAKERGYTMREAHLTEREEELAKGWKLLEDRKATFERRINRLKK